MSSDFLDHDAALMFVRSALNTFAKWDVATFFHNTPHAAVSAADIARFAGRDEREIADALDGLVASALLIARQASVHRVYRFSDDPALRDQVAQFVRACEDRAFRARAIQTVIDADANADRAQQGAAS